VAAIFGVGMISLAPYTQGTVENPSPGTPIACIEVCAGPLTCREAPPVASREWALPKSRRLIIKMTPPT
jgi:hypothetical protein